MQEFWKKMIKKRVFLEEYHICSLNEKYRMESQKHHPISSHIFPLEFHIVLL